MIIKNDIGDTFYYRVEGQDVLVNHKIRLKQLFCKHDLTISKQASTGGAWFDDTVQIIHCIECDRVIKIIKLR